MKVIFLDMDGVLNSSAYMTERAKLGKWDAYDDPGDWRAVHRWVQMIDPKAARRLHSLVELTGAKIVISSSWRHAQHWTRMETILRNAGCPCSVIGETPVLSRARGHEIAKWLDEHPPRPSHFVIFDDGSDAGEGGLAKWFVRTDLRYGLQDEHIAQALKILEPHIPSDEKGDRP
jgi:hypothetical protein